MCECVLCDLMSERRERSTRDPSLVVAYVCKVIIIHAITSWLYIVTVYSSDYLLLCSLTAAPEKRQLPGAQSQGAGTSCVSVYMFCSLYLYPV